MRFSVVLSLLLIGCGQDICIRKSDCVSGEVCGVNGLCGLAPDDAGETDAPDAADAGVEDAPDATDATDAADATTDATADAPTDGGP